MLRSSEPDLIETTYGPRFRWAAQADPARYSASVELIRTTACDRRLLHAMLH
jgi:hypothetical protein